MAEVAPRPNRVGGTDHFSISCDCHTLNSKPKFLQHVALLKRRSERDIPGRRPDQSHEYASGDEGIGEAETEEEADDIFHGRL